MALAGAFNKVSRVMRLTLALDAKLERDAARDAAAEAQEVKAEAVADAEAQAAQERRAAEQRRDAARATQPADPAGALKGRVRNLLKRLLWNESEGDYQDFEVLVDDLNSRLEEAALSPEFTELPIETLVHRVIADMGLSGEFVLSLAEPKPAPARELQTADTG